MTDRPRKVQKKASQTQFLVAGNLYSPVLLFFHFNPCGMPQVVLELIELREVDTARALLRNAAVFAPMRLEEPDRFLRMEHLCARTYFDIR